MRLLILGGTWFLGRTLAADALARGWHVTAFSRGRSGSPPAGAEHVQGDRRAPDDIRRLALCDAWDATIDTSAYESGDVTGIVETLGGNAGRYVLMSTVSAYRDWPVSAVTEDSPLWPSRLDAREADPDMTAMRIAISYGTLKAGCELAARTAPDGALIFRPGVILGPGEYVGRMLTLFARAARGGRWLLPGPPEQPIQPVDVRDVSTFVLDRIAAGDARAYNVTAPTSFATYGELIEARIAVTSGPAEPVWVDPDWLLAQGVGEWEEIPLWRTRPGTWAVDSRAAFAAGFRCRPLAETVIDTYRSFQTRPPLPHPRQADHGMTADKEAALLAQWDDLVQSGR